MQIKHGGGIKQHESDALLSASAPASAPKVVTDGRNQSDAENLVRWTNSHLRRDSLLQPGESSVTGMPMASDSHTDAVQVDARGNSQAHLAQSQESIAPSSVASRQSSTSPSDTSIEEMTDTSDTEFHDTRSHSPNPSPFLYPVPQDMVPQITASTVGTPSGYATPHMLGTPSLSGQRELRNMHRETGNSTKSGSLPLHVPAGVVPRRPSLTHSRRSSAGLMPLSTASSALSPNLESATANAAGSSTASGMERTPMSLLSRMHQQKLEQYSRASSPISARFPPNIQAPSPGAPPNDPNTPLTPTAIMSRRSSMVGAPALWMTSQGETASGANTPTLMRSQAQSPNAVASPKTRWTPFASGMTRMDYASPSHTRSATPRRRLSGPLAQELMFTATDEGEVPPSGEATSGENGDSVTSLWQRRNGVPAALPSVDIDPLMPLKAAEVEAEERNNDALTDAMLLHTNDILSNMAFEQERALLAQRGQRSMSLLDDSRPSLALMGVERPKEGEEVLPLYECTVHIEGYLPCKMEVDNTSSNASRPRAWEPMYFVLHGTALHLYKTDLSQVYAPNVDIARAWGLDYDGVLVHKAPMNDDVTADEVATSADDAGDSTSLEALVARGIELGRSYGRGQSQRSTSPYNQQLQKEEAKKGPASVAEFTHLLKQCHFHTYSMEGAQCGYAADYTKRPYVIRVKVANDQFLIKTRNNYHLVDWIEAMQGAINVSTDLDRRTMPKFVTLPRRRRRRRDVEAVVIREEPDTSASARRHAPLSTRQASAFQTPADGHLHSMAQSMHA